MKNLIRKILREDDWDWAKDDVFTWDDLTEGDEVSIHTTIADPLTSDGRTEIKGVVTTKNQKETCIKLSIPYRDMSKIGTHMCFDDSVNRENYYFKKIKRYEKD